MNVILQPYYEWPGHYKNYADFLRGDDDVIIKTSYKISKTYGVKFNFLRIWCMFISLVKCLKFSTRSKQINLFLLETEPFSLLLFFPVIFMFKHVTLTVHSVNKSSNSSKVYQLIIFFQRFFLEKYLRLATQCSNFSIVAHSEYHKEQIVSQWNIAADKVFVIDYPCPIPKHLPLKAEKLAVLIFGGIRPDKGMLPFFESLSDFGDQGIIINVVGRIEDDKVKSFAQNAPLFIKFIDSYVSEEELELYIVTNSYFVVPYGINYSGGAGPIKDAASFGRPVLALEHPLFYEVQSKGNYCRLFSSISDFYNLIKTTSSQDYCSFAEAATLYANSNNWLTIRERYLDVVKLSN